MHYYQFESTEGELIGLVPLCSDGCHREYAGSNYKGWDGAHETEFTAFCGYCGVVIPGEDACEHQRSNVVVSRFRSKEGEKCSHGNWIQIPSEEIEDSDSE
jgi:hypothetical protein